MKKQKEFYIRIVALVTFIVMILINLLANIIPFNGLTTGEVSASYPNLFAPAGITFAIWGLIYILLAIYLLYLFGIFHEDKTSANESVLLKTGILFSLTSIANTAWIFSWHFDNIPLSMILITVILVILIIIRLMLKKVSLSTKEKLFISLPFSVYFGWITVATVANATTLLVSLKWNGFGISEPIWTILILLVAAFIGIATTLKLRDIPYGLVFLWAYVGILIKHISLDGYAGKYPFVIAVIIVCIVAICTTLGLLIIPKKHLNKLVS